MLDKVRLDAETADTIEHIYDTLTEGGTLQQCLDLVRGATGAMEVTLEIETRGATVRHRCISSSAAEFSGDGAQDPDARSVLLATAGARITVECGTAHDDHYRLHLTPTHDGTPFPASRQDLAQDLLRHIRRAHRLAAQIDRSNQERSVYSSALDRLAVGAIFLDVQGKVIHATRVAQDLIDSRDGLQLTRGGLAAADAADNRALQSAIRGKLSQSDAIPRQKPQTLVVSRPSGGRELGLIVHSLRCQPEAPGGFAAVVMIRDPDRSGAPERAILRNLFAMTAAEAEVACSLTSGLSLDETAQSLNISRNTARTHLRSIFSKSGISRQTELMRLMLSSAAVLGMTPLAGQEE
ncbi:helix-turn-helix transcriptional regulator [Stappia stellulata]|uniref:helix-turn-helix transcriptional regulator n=1 Tax=Stappia stellulata TaxID=71235 RepID=UPI00146B5E97|nr:helix-turn-helix transcriptional regulator [Stappia stellulata]